ncbi:unnamed protein product [Penicillium glandicola]
MLDEEHEPLPQPRGDTNVYNLGSINNHNVVIAGLPQAGNCFAATAVTQMMMTFPNLKYALLVGIGGGVPVKTDHGMIRLGHIVAYTLEQYNTIMERRRLANLNPSLTLHESCAIVVTTRSSMVKLGQTIHLRKLEDTGHSLDILASVSGRGDLKQDPAAVDIAKQLDGIPLALATAGAYLEQVLVTCDEYLQLYSESWRQLHE